jgi:hypothetical protein
MDLNLENVIKIFLAPVIVGAVMGAFSSYVTMTAMMSTIEERMRAQEIRIVAVEKDIKLKTAQDRDTLEQLTRVETKLDILLERD